MAGQSGSTPEQDQHSSISIIRRNGLYLLPDQTIADVTQILSWCFSCNQFTDGELIRSPEEFQSILANCREEVPSPYIGVCETETMVDRFSQHIDRCLNWRRFRTSPPRCLDCGGTNIKPIHQPAGTPFVDPLGRQVVWTDRVVCTDLDNQLFVFNENGVHLLAMPLHCPISQRQIFDEFPPDEFLKLFELAKQSQ